MTELLENHCPAAAATSSGGGVETKSIDSPQTDLKTSSAPLKSTDQQIIAEELQRMGSSSSELNHLGAAAGGMAKVKKASSSESRPTNSSSGSSANSNNITSMKQQPASYTSTGNKHLELYLPQNIVTKLIKESVILLLILHKLF
ncbi:MAG: hypothetical protein MHMPM18_004187 [Marteilia pararefringens]